MTKMKLMTLLMCLTLVFGCKTKTGTGALIGTGGGAILGAIVGKLAGNTAVGAAMGAAVGAGTGALIGKHMDKVAKQTADKVKNAKVEEVTDVNGLKAVKVTFDSGILFATNKADLNQGSKNELAKFSQVLKENGDCHVDIYGFTDNRQHIKKLLQNKSAKDKSSSASMLTTVYLLRPFIKVNHVLS